MNIDMTYDLASLTCRAGNEVGETNDTVRMKVTGEDLREGSSL